MKLRRVTADWLPAEPFYAKLERNGLKMRLRLMYP